MENKVLVNSIKKYPDKTKIVFNIPNPFSQFFIESKDEEEIARFEKHMKENKPVIFRVYTEEEL